MLKRYIQRKALLSATQLSGAKSARSFALLVWARVQVRAPLNVLIVSAQNEVIFMDLET